MQRKQRANQQEVEGSKDEFLPLKGIVILYGEVARTNCARQGTKRPEIPARFMVRHSCSKVANRRMACEQTRYHYSRLKFVNNPLNSEGSRRYLRSKVCTFAFHAFKSLNELKSLSRHADEKPCYCLTILA